MDDERFRLLIKEFDLKNDLTKNPNIWVGHAKIGFRNRPSIDDAKKILLGFFEDFIEEYEPICEETRKILSQWETDAHPYQKVRELDQPMFISKTNNTVVVAVIWPWQFKEGVASLMIYQGKLQG